MLLHTVDWWPQAGQWSGQATRDRLWHLFPVATMETTVRTLVTEREWALCRLLYDTLLYREMTGGRMTPQGALCIAVANARQVAHLWPAELHVHLAEALGAVVEHALDGNPSRRHLADLKRAATMLVNGWSKGANGTATASAMQAALGALRACQSVRDESALARQVVRVIGWAESAAIKQVPNVPAGERPDAIAGARAEVWRSAFLYLEVALDRHATQVGV